MRKIDYPEQRNFLFQVLKKNQHEKIRRIYLADPGMSLEKLQKALLYQNT
jgi:hypothetical protein